MTRFANAIARRARTRAALGIALAIGVARPVSAAAQEQEQESSSEVWPEVDVWVKLGPKLTLFFPLSVTRSRDTEYTEGLVGARVDYRFSRHVSARVGYGYLWSLSDAEPPYREHRPVAEVSLRAYPGASSMLADRTRFDMRFIDGVYSYRLRNRLRVEHTYSAEQWAKGRALTPYVMEELGYDSRYHTINRSRFTFGVELTFTPTVMMDVNIVRQNDSRASVGRLNALGLALNLTY